MNKSLIFNPSYHLRKDGNRVILFSEDEVPENSEEWFSFIHPFHAMMFSFMDGKTPYEEEIKKCATYFGVSFDAMEKIVAKYVDKRHWFTIAIPNEDCVNFPKNTIISVPINSETRKEYYSVKDFPYKGKPDLKSNRLSYPININMELTMKCQTNCLYCYAKRNLNSKDTLTLPQIKNFIREAKEGGVYNIDVNGGDVLLHPQIREVLLELVSQGFMPLVSTKTTLDKDMIDYIVALKKVRLQISLDSANPITLRKLIGVPSDYIEKMSSALDYLSLIDFPVKVNVVLTRYNSSKEEIDLLLDYLSKYRAVKEIRFNPCGYSLYKKNFSEIRMSLDSLIKALEYIESQVEQRKDVTIKISSYDKSTEYVGGDKPQAFANRALCTGGIRNAVLLPNGDLTICEELYDHPAFLLGNVKENSISEIWNSEKAIKLYRDPVSVQSKSVCARCSNKQICRMDIGVCWKLVLMAYGKENWDFPDPRCPKAPSPLNSFFYE